MTVSNEGGERLIPAHAGKTTPPLTPPVKKMGSSPLTRGKQFPLIFCPFRPGLIPAHAGKTRSPRAMPPAPRAHPRSRGENTAAAALTFGTTGSSPLTRGKQLRGGRRKGLDRLIPAHAGKTRPIWWHHGRRRAHPRSRGENRKDGFDAFPHAWLIPAHAGKTTTVRLSA